MYSSHIVLFNGIEKKKSPASDSLIDAKCLSSYVNLINRESLYQQNLLISGSFIIGNII